MAQSKSGKQKANNRIKAAGKEAEKQTQKDTAEQLAESWAERIRTAIDQSAMTDLDIAKEVTKRGISLSPRTIYNWKLNGGMSRDYIDPFCDVVGCDKLWMLTGESHQALQLVHSKEDISPGLQQRHHAIPLLETGDLMEVAERLDHVEDHDVGSSGWMRDRIEAWMDNPAATTEVYIPMLSGHRHEEVVPGIPRYCLQVSQADHDTPGHPWLWQGQLLGMATDVWPSRDEFAMFLRQPIHENGTPGLWSLHAGFYRADAWSVPKDADEWWKHASANRVDRHFTLHVRENEIASDDSVISFKEHNFLYLGVCVYRMGWQGAVRNLTNTRLLDRKAYASQRRVRDEGLDSWP